MRILIEQTQTAKNIKKEVLVSSVLKKIWILVKNDPDFYLKDKIEKIKELEKKFVKKHSMLVSLLESSESLKSTMLSEIDSLSKSSEEKRLKLLEKLKRNIV